MTNIDSLKNFCFCQATIFNSDAELIDDLFSRHIFFSDCFFESGMQFLVLSAEIADLLDGVKTSNCWYELLFRDLLIIV